MQTEHVGRNKFPTSVLEKREKKGRVSSSEIGKN